MSKKTTPAAPASAPAPAPTPVTASAGTPGDMAAALADNDDVMVAAGSTADAPVMQASAEPEPASGKPDAAAAQITPAEPNDEEARLTARIADLGDPHAIVVAAAAQITPAEPNDEEARLTARIADLGDPHAIVVAAAARLTKAREEQFETSISLEQAVNLAMDNLRRVQAQAQIDKEEIRLCKLRLEQIASARDADDKAAAATAAHKAKST